VHEAFFYSSDEDFVTRLTPFLRDGAASNQGAIAVTTESRIALLRRRLGADADAVSFFDAGRWYRRPGAALLAWRDVFDQQLRDGAAFVRAVGEIAFANDEAGIRRWMRYESLINRAFADRPTWIVCPYNIRAVPKEVLAAARQTHPVVSMPSGREPSTPHFDARELGADVAPAADRSDAEKRTRATVSDPQDLAEFRRRVRWDAQSAGLAAEVVDDLLLAIGELLRRSLADDGATANVRTARQNGEWFSEISLERTRSNAPSLGAGDLGLLIGRMISDRVEIADDDERALVRFVFGRQPADPRQRIVSAASELFRANGVRSTGINAVIAHANVAKATFYAQFQSKDELVRLWLRSPAARWFDQVRAEVEIRTQTPAERLTAFFDVLGEWLSEDRFRGCPFLNTAAEFRNADGAFSQELADLTAEIEEYFRCTAAEAGVADPDGIAAQLFLLVPGAITAATARASAEPARIARAAAEGLVASAALV
jgi:AcrR family transcriptional regulator